MVTTIVGNRLLGPLLAHGGVASVATVSELVPEAAGGDEGHLVLVLAHVDLALGVRLVQRTYLPVDAAHDVRIGEGLLQGMKVERQRCWVADTRHADMNLRRGGWPVV